MALFFAELYIEIGSVLTVVCRWQGETSKPYGLKVYNDYGWELNELLCVQREVMPPERHLYTITARVGEYM